MNGTTYRGTALCLLDKSDEVSFWLPRQMRYEAAKAFAELNTCALVLYDISVAYVPKNIDSIVCVEDSKKRVYPDKTKAILDSANEVHIVFRRGELFKKAMSLAEEMGLVLSTIQVEVTETIMDITKDLKGSPKFFEDFRKG